MTRQRMRAHSASLAALVALIWAAPADAQDPEVFLISYPNAQITVDGDVSDWNLGQFGTFVDGGVAVGGDVDEWDRLGGTGDIARLGWDDAGENVYYGALWSAQMLPDDRADNSVKIYARDNETHQYFLADIIDDEIYTDDPEEAAWANDSVEFYIDPGNERGPRVPDGEWDPIVQLVIDADNRVQVWNSPIDYEEQVEAGVDSAVTITDTGWILEVGIDKSVFSTPIPAVLGPANDPAGNNFGIDFSYRDADDPDGVGTRNGDINFSTDYVWADPDPEPAFPTKIPDHWGQMIVGTPLDLASQIDQIKNLDERITFVHEVAKTWMGDSNLDGEFNSTDFVEVFTAGEYEDTVPANSSWSTGDWNGDDEFDSSDFVVAFTDGGYEIGEFPAPVAVPEPLSGALLLSALACWFPLRRPRH